MHPVETTTLLILDDEPFQTASAKGNGGGGGNNGSNNGGGNSGNAGNNSKGKSSLAGSSKSNNGRSKNGTNGRGNNVKDLFDKLFSRSKKPPTSAKASRPAKSIARKKPAKISNQVELANLRNIAVPKVRPIPVFDFMHPRNLGKLNGALNSSPQAKLAHMLNGNLNGPVGLAAALALADYEFQNSVNARADAAALVALDLVALTAAFALLPSAPTEQQLIDAQTLIAESGLSELPTAEDIAAAQALVDQPEPTEADINDAEMALLDAYKGGELIDDQPEQLLIALRASLPTIEEYNLALIEQAEKAAAEATEASEATPDAPVVE